MADKDTPDRVKTVPRRPFKVTDYETHMAFKRAKIMTEGVGKGDFDTPVNVAIKEYVESMIRSQKNRFIFSGIAPNVSFFCYQKLNMSSFVFGLLLTILQG